MQKRLACMLVLVATVANANEAFLSDEEALEISPHAKLQ